MNLRWEKIRLGVEGLTAGFCVLVFLLFVAGMVAALAGRHAAGSRDFVEYWASGQLLAHGGNPYDCDAVRQLERSVGFEYERPLLMLNPPWFLGVVLPLGFVGARTGLALWSLMLLSSLLASVRMLWLMHGRPESRVHWLGYSFGPALVCLLAGQIGTLLLLGLTLFLRWHRSRPFYAGVSLWLCMLKPQLFLPFGAVFLLWVTGSRSYRVLAGAVAAMGASLAIAFLIDPHGWAQYGEMIRAARVSRLDIPCVSTMFRLAIAPGVAWLQYVPVGLGTLWGCIYFGRHRRDWDWREHGALLTMVSLMTASYAWFTDQAILIPALLHAAYAVRSRSLLVGLALISAGIEVGAFHGITGLMYAPYVWTAPAWFAWYLLATRAGRPTGGDGAANGEESNATNSELPEWAAARSGNAGCCEAAW